MEACIDMKANVLSGNPLLGPVVKEARKNWKTIMVLTALFLLGLAIRTTLYYQESVDSGEKLMSTDPFYHKRVIDFVVEEKHHLVRDPRLGYPAEPYNPHPPVFDWSIAVASVLLGPFFGTGRTAMFLTQFWAPFWGSLTVVPVYFLTKEYFGRKAGLWAAFFLTIMPAHIDRSTFGFGDHDAFNLFFVVVAFFFLVKALRHEKAGRYIEDFRSPRSVLRGVRAYANHNSISLGYSMMAAISMSTVALAWKGFSYVFAIIIVYYFAQLLVNAFRHTDSTGLAITMMTVLTLPILLALPAYSSMNMIWSQWGLRPVVYVYAGAWFLTLAFVPTRDVPWLILLPSLLVAGTIGYFIVLQINPALAETLLSGAGYFVKSKRYSTIAEAQAPNLSRLILSYGPVTFFFALAGIPLAVMRFIRHWRIDELFVSMWTFLSIFMALSATRFMFNAGPAFAVLQGWVAFLILDKADFRAISKTLRGFSGQFWHGLRKGFSVKHAAVALFMVFMVLLPNAWYAFDASIPYEKKREIDTQIYDSMPEWLRPEKYDRDSTLWYTGAFGGSFPSEYWYTFFEWFADQDGEYEVEDRPAFLSWWDYGMECVQLGQHPTVADNFMNGHEMAGNFIAAENETLGMSLIITRLLEFKIRHENSADAKALLERYIGAEDTATFVDALRNPSDYIRYVNDHPEIYGRKDGLRQNNAKYSVCARLIGKLNDTELTQMLLDTERMTGHRIRYFAVDSRMFPFSYENTGIFYAPITLSDHYVSDFLETLVKVGGRLVTPEEYEEMLELDPDLEIDDLVISYTKRFYNTMFYRAYIGYSAEDVGGNSSMGIPGLSGQMAGQPPMQGWMQRHFKLYYKTTYWNPHEKDEVKDNPDDWRIVPFDDALDWSEDENITGTADFQTGLVQGVMVLKYYHGAIVSGMVATPGGVPLPNARVTVADDYGIPHDIATTDDQGRYRLIAPAGEKVTFTVSRGGKLNGITQTFEEVLESVNITITEDQAERRETDDDGNGVPDYLVDLDIELNSTTINGTLFWDSDQDERFDPTEDPVADAVIELNGTNVLVVRTAGNGTFNTSDALDGKYDVFLLRDGDRFDLDRSIKVDGAPVADQEIGVQGFLLKGSLEYEDGDGVKGAVLEVEDRESDASFRVRTDSEGDFKLDDILPGDDGDAELGISLVVPGKVPIVRTVRARMGQRVDLKLVLRNSSYISGTALLGDGVGSPAGRASGVMVIAEGQVIGEAVADTDGAFNVTVPEGRYTLSARYTDGDDLLTAMVGVDAPASGVELVLEPTFTVGGTVYVDKNGDGEFDASSDTRASHARIEITGPRVWSGRANAAGQFSAGLPVGDHYMNVLYEGEGNKTYVSGTWFTVGSDKPMDVSVELAQKVSGSVFWDGDLDGKAQPTEYIDGIPLVFAGEHRFTAMTGLTHVRLEKYYADGFFFDTFSVSTGSNGSFQVLLAPGNYTVSSPNFVSVELDDWSDPLLNMTPLPAVVRGVVYADEDMDQEKDAAEIPGPGLNLTVERTEAPVMRTFVETDGEGAFSLELLPGRYEVRANGTDDEGTMFVTNFVIDVPYGEAAVENDVIAGRLVRFAPTFVEDGVALDPDDFGAGDFVRIVTHPLPEEKSVPTESGSREWQYGGYIYPGEYDLYAVHGGEVALRTFSVREASSPAIELEEAVGYDVDLITKDRATREVRDLDDLRVTVISAEEVKGLPNPFNMTYPWGHPQMTEIVEYSGGYNFTLTLPPGKFTISVNATKTDDRYLLNGTLRNGTLAVVRNFRLMGYVYYDRDDDGKRDTNEGIEGVRIVAEGAADVGFSSGSKGAYETFLPYGETGFYELSVVSPGYAGIVEPTNISLPTGSENIAVEPLPASISGTAFHDADGNGRIDDGEERDISSLEFIIEVDGRVRSIAIDGPDYSAQLMPGDYVVQAYSAEEAVLFEHKVDIGDDGRLNLNMTPAVSASGAVYYENLTGTVNLATTAEMKEDLTLTSTDDEGSAIVLEIDNGQYSTMIPAGEYRVKGSFEIEEFGTVREYSVNRKMEFAAGGTHDIELTREDDYSVKLEWRDETVRTPADTNITYTVRVSNEGNVLTNVVKLAKSSVPDGWAVRFNGERTLTLGQNETADVDVTIYVPEEAKAGEDRVRIKATPEGDDRKEETVSLTVNVSASYAFDLETVEPVRGVMTGSFTLVDFLVASKANAPDTFEIEIPELPKHFRVTMMNATMAGLTDSNDDGRNDTGSLRPFEGVPVFLNVSADDRAGGRIGIPVTVTSVESGIVRTLDLTVEVTRPDLRSELTVERGTGEDADTVFLNATVYNVGLINVDLFEVKFFMDGEPVGDNDTIEVNGQPIGDVNQSLAMHANRTYTLELDDVAAGPGSHAFSFSAVIAGGAGDLNPDLNPDDNYASQTLTVAKGEGGGHDDAWLLQVSAAAVIAAALVIAYAIYRRRRRW